MRAHMDELRCFFESGAVGGADEEEGPEADAGTLDAGDEGVGVVAVVLAVVDSSKASILSNGVSGGGGAILCGGVSKRGLVLDDGTRTAMEAGCGVPLPRARWLLLLLLLTPPLLSTRALSLVPDSRSRSPRNEGRSSSSRPSRSPS